MHMDLLVGGVQRRSQPASFRQSDTNETNDINTNSGHNVLTLFKRGSVVVHVGAAIISKMNQLQ